jgi:hypothetical protein
MKPGIHPPRRQNSVKTHQNRLILHRLPIT